MRVVEKFGMAVQGPARGFLTALMARCIEFEAAPCLPRSSHRTTNYQLNSPIMQPRRQTPKIPSGMLAAMRESNQAILQNMEEDFVRLTLADLMGSSIIPADAILPSEASVDDGDLKNKNTHSPLYEKFLKHSTLNGLNVYQHLRLTTGAENSERKSC